MTKAQTKRMQRAYKLVKEMAKEICPRLRNDAGNYPVPDCLSDATVIRPCYTCRSRKALSREKKA